VVFCLFIVCAFSAGPPTPPTTGAFESGNYRNLLKEYGYADADIQKKIDTAWTSLFGGGSDSTVYYTSGNDRGYILDVNNNDVRSEGMSYGLMLAVQLNKQDVFDKIFKWATSYMRYNTASDPNYLYYRWQMDRNGGVKGTTPASDGEEYIVTALIFAAGRWGSSSNFNYKTEYQNLLYKLIHVPSNNNGVTNLFDTATHEVTFCPIGNAAKYTDPSYHLPAFYEIWARVANTSADQSFWKTAASTSRDYFQKAFNNLGLNPDYSNFDGSIYSSAPDHAYFSYDAWRTIQNVGVDYAWWAADKREVELATKVLSFFYGKGKYGNQYNMNGNERSSTHSLGHVAMNAAGGLASNNNNTWSFIQELWGATPPTGTYRYYDGLLYFLSLLHTSGNFKIYMPK